MLKDKRVLAIIPARGGSKTVPKKNIRPIAGKPLIAYTIEEALKSRYVDRVIVSTDDREIARIAKRYGAEVPFLRPKSLAMDTSPSLLVILHTLRYLGKKESYSPDIVVFLQPTSPFRTAKHIDAAVEKIKDADAVVGICEVKQHPYFMMRERRGLLVPYLKIRDRPLRRQDVPKLHISNASLYVTKRDYYDKVKKTDPVAPVFTGKVKGVIMDEISSIDIDTSLDFSFAESLMKSGVDNRLKDIKIGNKKIGGAQPTFVIAEMACGHEGKVDLAKKLIKIAADVKADAIKFHIISPDDYIVPSHEVYKLTKKIELSKKEWGKFFNYARKFGLLTIAMPNDIPSARLARKNRADGYYIHSANLSDRPLIEEIAKAGKPVFIGTGASTLEEINNALKIINSQGNTDIVLMHGYQAYPTKIEDTHLRFLEFLKQTFQTHVGFCDHTDGESELCGVIPLLAIPYGAVALEKHFTIDRKLKLIDYQSAMNPDELKRFIKNLRSIEKVFGSSAPHKLSKAELKYRKLVKKNIVANEDIKKGQKITEEMIAFKRSEPGISPLDANKVVGKIAKVNIKKNENIEWRMLE